MTNNYQPYLVTLYHPGSQFYSPRIDRQFNLNHLTRVHNVTPNIVHLFFIDGMEVVEGENARKVLEYIERMSLRTDKPQQRISAPNAIHVAVNDRNGNGHKVEKMA